MGAFTRTLDSHLGEDHPGGPAGMHPPGPSQNTGTCNWCPEEAYIFMPALPCNKRPSQLCVRHFVTNAKQHATCRLCFRPSEMRRGY